MKTFENLLTGMYRPYPYVCEGHEKDLADVTDEERTSDVIGATGVHMLRNDGRELPWHRVALSDLDCTARTLTDSEKVYMKDGIEGLINYLRFLQQQIFNKDKCPLKIKDSAPQFESAFYDESGSSVMVSGKILQGIIEDIIDHLLK